MIKRQHRSCRQAALAERIIPDATTVAFGLDTRLALTGVWGKKAEPLLPDGQLSWTCTRAHTQRMHKTRVHTVTLIHMHLHTLRMQTDADAHMHTTHSQTNTNTHTHLTLGA